MIPQKEKQDIAVIHGQTEEKEITATEIIQAKIKVEKEKAKTEVRMVKAKEEKAKVKMERDPTAMKKAKANPKETRTKEKEESPKEKERMVIIEADLSNGVNRQQDGHPRDYQIDHYVVISKQESAKLERHVPFGTQDHAKHIKVATALTEVIVFSATEAEKVITDVDDQEHQEDSISIHVRKHTREQPTKTMMNGMRMIGKRMTMMMIGKKTNGMRMIGKKEHTLMQREMQVKTSNGNNKRLLHISNLYKSILRTVSQ